MELRHLRYFAAVADEENVTRAAARLHVSQPPLSRQIRQLEEELRVDLFDRSGRSMRLTEAGRFFRAEAQAILARVDQATAAVRAVATGNEGELHIGYAPSLTTELLPRALRDFQAAAPGIRLRLHDLSTTEILIGINERTLHTGLLVHPGAKALKGLEFEETHRFGASVAMAPSHPLAYTRRVTPASLRHERLLGYSSGEYPEYGTWLKSFHHPTGPLLAEEYDSASSLIAAVEAGNGVAIVQEGFQRQAGPRLMVKPLEGVDAPLTIGMARLKGSTDRATALFWKMVLATCRAENEAVSTN